MVALLLALTLTDGSRDNLRRLSEYYKEAPHRVSADDNAARFFERFKRVFAQTPADVTLDVELSWRKTAKVSVTAELAGHKLVSEQEEAPMSDARVRVRTDLYRELAMAGERAAADLEKQLAALGPLAAEPEKAKTLAPAEAREVRPGFTEAGDAQAIHPRPYRDELLSALVPDGVFDVSGLTRFTLKGRPECYVDVEKPESPLQPKAWKKRMLLKFDLLHSQGWKEKAGSRRGLPWVRESIRFEGGWVLIGEGYRVVSVCPKDEDWFAARADVILRSLKVN